MQPPSIWQQDAKEAATIAKNGGVILYPTDTVWGLGCAATNQQAIEQIREIKGRKVAKSFIVLVKDVQQLRQYVGAISEDAFRLIEKTPRPLTIIYNHVLGLAEGVYAEDGTVAVRIVQDQFCQEMIAELGTALVSTSANISGQPSRGDFESIPSSVRAQVDYIAKHRQNEPINASPSKIVRVTQNGIEVIRD